MNWCKFFSGNPCKAKKKTFFQWNFCLGLLVLDAFFTLWRVEKSRRRTRLCRFCTIVDIVSETANVSFRRLPVGFPVHGLLEFFVRAVLFPDSWPRRSSQNFHFWPQSSYFEFLVRYFFSPLSSICVNQVLLSSDESPYCTIPIRSWASQTLVFLICTILPRCHQVRFSS